MVDDADKKAKPLPLQAYLKVLGAVSGCFVALVLLSRVLFPGETAVTTLHRSIATAVPRAAVKDENRLTLVLPLTLDDLDRYSLLIETMNAFFDLDTVHELLLVAPPAQLNQLRDTKDLARLSGVKTRFLADTDIVPELGYAEFVGRKDSPGFPGRGWGYIVQQIIKLAVSDWVDTEFYMTLDADLLVVQPCKWRHLMTSRRAHTNMESRQAHDPWWQASAKVLELYNVTESAPDTPVFGVTPALLSTKVLRKMGRYIQDRFRSPWRLYLLQHLNGWTEYTLYYTFAVASGLFPQLHDVTVSDGVYRLKESMWQPTQDLGPLMQALMTPAEQGSCFLVVQSFATTAEQVHRILAPFLHPHQ